MVGMKEKLKQSQVIESKSSIAKLGGFFSSMGSRVSNQTKNASSNFLEKAKDKDKYKQFKKKGSNFQLVADKNKDLKLLDSQGKDRYQEIINDGEEIRKGKKVSGAQFLKLGLFFSAAPTAIFKDVKNQAKQFNKKRKNISQDYNLKNELATTNDLSQSVIMDSTKQSELIDKNQQQKLKLPKGAQREQIIEDVITKMFKQLDDNFDGELGLDEVTKLVQATSEQMGLPKPSQQDCQEAFASIDFDFSGGVDWAEFKNFIRPLIEHLY